MDNISVSTLTPAHVISAYEGRKGCMCGCRGDYFVTPENRALAEEDRGYTYEDTDVSLPQVTRILATVQCGKGKLEVTPTGDGVSCVTLEKGRQVWAVYVRA